MNEKEINRILKPYMLIEKVEWADKDSEDNPLPLHASPDTSISKKMSYDEAKVLFDSTKQETEDFYKSNDITPGDEGYDGVLLIKSKDGMYRVVTFTEGTGVCDFNQSEESKAHGDMEFIKKYLKKNS
ncbi:MAG: hypothetical protein IMZ52_05890 [Actinobacteria bacterium]|nr:hypothetical protein [Actinomycetota bacterium]MBE3114878.1 hypothetical protein [Actinomycetota bacterium]